MKLDPQTVKTAAIVGGVVVGGVVVVSTIATGRYLLFSKVGDGTQGAAAKTAQKRLNKHGASLAVDGNFGESSVAALKAFQTSKGLPVTGVTDPATWLALTAAPKKVKSISLGTTTPTFAWPITEYATRHGDYGPRYITSGFGPRSCTGCSTNHKGIDIGVETGTPVMATADGIVRDIRENSGDAGTYITLEHDGNYWSRYLHLSGYNVAVGDSVKKGQNIAPSGGEKGAWGAGSSQGPHLHFEIWTGAPRESGSVAHDPEKMLTEEQTPITKEQAVALTSAETSTAGGDVNWPLVLGVSVGLSLLAVGFVYRDEIRDALQPARARATA